MSRFIGCGITVFVILAGLGTAPGGASASEQMRTLKIFCAGLMVQQLHASDSNALAEAAEVTENTIDELAKSEGIQPAEARARILGLADTFHGWDGVAAACVDQGWFLSQKTVDEYKQR